MEGDILLKSKEYASSESNSGPIGVDFKEEGLRILKLTSDDLQKIGAMFSLVYRQNSSTRNANSMLFGAVFSLGSKQYGNPEWREQCAGSLREIIDECNGPGKIANWFNNTFSEKNENFPNNSTHPDIYKKINDFYGYFSKIHHHDSKNILYKMQDLYGIEKKVGDDSETFFVTAVRDFIVYLADFFDKYVKNI